MRPQPDLIVIGGGSAGAACAARLAEGGKRVLLIEAGKGARDPRIAIPALMGGLVFKPDFDWCFMGEPDPSVGGRPDVWPAARRLGGGSSINGMMFIRGHPWDYDHWAELGATGWDYAGVLPYFRRLEDNARGANAWRGRGGPVSVSEIRSRYDVTDRWIEAVEQAGFPRSPDLNGEHAEGVDTIQLSQRRGLRVSTAAAYLSPPPEGLEVLTEAEVARIAIEQGRAVGVTLRGGETIRARVGVVLSAGALNTPRLLMLSGIGPAQALKALGIDVVRDLPGVGGNLQEHSAVHLVNEVSAHTLNDDSRGLAGVWQALRLLVGGSGALTTGIGHAQAFVKGRKGLAVPNLQLAFSAFAFDITPQGNLALRPQSSITTLVGLMRPSSRGRVSLRSPDPADKPGIEHTLLGGGDDVAQLVEGLALARKIVGQPALAPFVTSEVRPGAAASGKAALTGYVRAATIPMFHPVGTAKIGAARDKAAVVGPDLKLHGIDGLWVADASIMPTIPQGNTNATAIMIGEKASDLVLAALR